MTFILKILLNVSAYFSRQHAYFSLENGLVKWAIRFRQRHRSDARAHVAILGASFNPTTLGHVDFIRVLLGQVPHNFMRIDLIPTAQSPLKSVADYASVTDRLQILKLVLHAQFTVQERAHLHIETLEITRHAPSWMVLTLSALLLRCRGRESYVLACGYDHILQMQQWYRWQDLAHLCELHFYPRQGVEIIHPAAAQACVALCRNGLQVMVFFLQAAEIQQFETLCQCYVGEEEQTFIHNHLRLQYAPQIDIRASSATDIRTYYQNATPDQVVVPMGLSSEGHDYIMAHHCYKNVHHDCQ